MDIVPVIRSLRRVTEADRRRNPPVARRLAEPHGSGGEGFNLCNFGLQRLVADHPACPGARPA